MSFRFTKPHPARSVGPGLVIAVGFVPILWRPAGLLWADYLSLIPKWFSFAGGIFVLHFVLFWSLCLGFAYVDRCDRPRFIAKHRIQNGKRRQPPLSKVIRVLAINQLVLLPLLLALSHVVLDLRGFDFGPSLPSPLRFVLELAGLGVISLVIFYASHRFLHDKWWMKRVHRVHHEYRTPSAISAEYAHPIEFIFGNFMSLGLGVLVIAPSLYATYVFVVIATFSFVVHHSGYALPWYSWAVYHDWHHYRVKEAFGTVGTIDGLLGTDPDLRKLEHLQEV